MKRHKSLVPLSRDHHDGLVVAQGLIKGRSTAPGSTWPSDRTQQASRLVVFFETHLRKHFEVEETHLFPVVRASLRDGPELVNQLTSDHDVMRGWVRDLVQDSTTGLADRLRSFGKLLEAHIRTEERLLFERIQEEMDPVELETIGMRLHDHYPSDSNGPACRS